MSSIGYDLTKIRGIVFDVDGVLSPSTVPIADDGTPSRMANVKDGYAMQRAIHAGYKIAIISGGISETVEKRFEIIGIKDVFMGIREKLPVLKSWMALYRLCPDEIAYVGDDLPDIQCMKYAGLSVAPADAAAEVRGISRYISHATGGNGVARDIIEQIMKAKGEWLHADDAYNW